GFWVYLMSDCVLFATLFATYAVLSSNSIAGPTGKEIFELPFVFVETMLLLLSSITFGFGIIAMKRNDVAGLKRWMLVTFALGLGFICMEVYEFHHLIKEGYGPQTSAFLS
ncbi:cytochrome o ubiquinol oxidase subunit III, partial [Escherichia coli]|nr:cytochrome o ubiquinol oxidase subunit III [Escherichia coli]